MCMDTHRSCPFIRLLDCSKEWMALELWGGARWRIKNFFSSLVFTFLKNGFLITAGLAAKWFEGLGAKVIPVFL